MWSVCDCVTVYSSCTSRSPKKIHPLSSSRAWLPSIAISLSYYQRLSFAHQSVSGRTSGGKAALPVPLLSLCYRTIKHVPYGSVSSYFVLLSFGYLFVWSAAAGSRTLCRYVLYFYVDLFYTVLSFFSLTVTRSKIIYVVKMSTNI